MSVSLSHSLFIYVCACVCVGVCEKFCQQPEMGKNMIRETAARQKFPANFPQIEFVSLTGKGFFFSQRPRRFVLANQNNLIVICNIVNYNNGHYFVNIESIA